jgi:hypothetical protein
LSRKNVSLFDQIGDVHFAKSFSQTFILVVRTLDAAFARVKFWRR